MKLLNEILGTKYPIIQGGMANIATGEFAAACSNAGALGLIGSGGMDADSLRENIRRCRALTDKPFGVNIMLMHPQADEFAKIVVEEGVKLVTTGAGNPGKYMAAWKAAGITVIPVVAAAILAKHLEPLGIDAVIAEGTESGGHVGEMTTMALVPQVVDAVHVPVIAAGGIADGRGLAAALALGACGVQVGTCLLTSTECPIHENYKAALLKARDSDTIVTGRIGGTPLKYVISSSCFTAADTVLLILAVSQFTFLFTEFLISLRILTFSSSINETCASMIFRISTICAPSFR